MKKEPIFKKLIVISTLTILVGLAGCFTTLTLPGDATSSCNISITAPEFATWFESGTVALNGSVKPANSVTFPGNPNCDFYKWSEQMFLWLTSPAPARYGGGGLVMNSPAFFDVSPEDAMHKRTFIPHQSGFVRPFSMRAAQLGAHNLPVILDKGKQNLLEVLKPVFSPGGKQLILNAEGKQVEIGNAKFNDNKRLVFFDLAGKEILGARPITFSNSDSLAGISRLRFDKTPDFERKKIVQKFMIGGVAIFLDLDGNVVNVEPNQSNGEVLMAQNGSLVFYTISVNQVYAYFRTMQGAGFTKPSGVRFPISQSQLDNITNFATTNGKTIIDPQALAIEIKASWVEAEGLADKDKFIQMQGTIPTYDKADQNNWVPNGQKTVMLALVGLHVVGSTAGHPEMLWATFEHISNAPNASYTYTKIPSGIGNISQSTTGNWVFCAAGTTSNFNQPHMQINGSSIVPISPFSISASNTLREMPFGMSGANSNSNAEVITINNSVRGMLIGADLRKNYIQTGTTWTIGGAAPTGGIELGGNEVGTNHLANTTMETYSQGGNCFNCHSNNTTDVSHVFDKLKPLF